MNDPKKEIPPGDAVGLLPDGGINIGPPEEMRKRFEQAQRESADAEDALAESGEEDFGDLE